MSVTAPHQLDCVTPRGRLYINHQHECINRLCTTWKTQIFTTPDQEAADIDGIGTRGKEVASVLEIKCREADLTQLRRWGSYLITFDKLIKLRNAARALVVPGFIVVSLLRDKQIVYWHVCDRLGNLLVPIKASVTATQATCNGGEARRYNAYLDVEAMTVL